MNGIKSTALDGGNSGATAMLYAAANGADELILIGYDCKAGEDGKRHWHKRHKPPLTDAVSLPKFYEQFERVAGKIGDTMVTNCSRDTALDMWPVADLAETLNRRVGDG